jgi:hypothetical protein
MKRTILFSTALAVLFCLSGFPLMAQGRSGAGGPAGGPGAGQGQGPGMGQGQPGNGPTGREPTMGNPGMGGDTNTTTNQTMGHVKTPTQLLMQNPKLSNQLQTMLPEGTNVQDAASGFNNLGEFVAAVHISQNLNIPFDQFKQKVTNGDSLGKALQELNPSLNHKEVKSEVKKAKKQAKEDIKTSRQS